jgi:hypothetical protein
VRLLDLDANALLRTEYSAADVDLSPSIGRAPAGSLTAGPPASYADGAAGNPELLFSRGAYARPLTPEPAPAPCGGGGEMHAGARPAQQTPPEKVPVVSTAAGRTPGQLAFRSAYVAGPIYSGTVLGRQNADEGIYFGSHDLMFASPASYNLIVF